MRIENEIIPIHEGIGRKGRQIPRVPIMFFEGIFEEQIENDQFVQKNDPCKKWVNVEDISTDIFQQEEEESEKYREKFVQEPVKDYYKEDARDDHRQKNFIVFDNQTGFINAACYDGRGHIDIIRSKKNPGSMLDRNWYRKKDLYPNSNGTYKNKNRTGKNRTGRNKNWM